MNKSGVIVIEGHVQGLSNTRSLGESGIPVIVVDKNTCLAQHSRYCNKFIICPVFNSPEFVNFLLDIADSLNLKGWLLLPSNDHAVYSISKNKEKLKTFYKIITPGLEIIDQIYNKERLLISASEVKIPYPVSWFPKKFEEEMPLNLNFPVLIKGKFGLNFYKRTGQKAFLIERKDQLNTVMGHLQSKISADDLFIQELIPLTPVHKTISFTAFCIGGDIKTHWMGVKLREHPIQFGTATCANSVSVDVCYKQSAVLLKQLNYTGVCEVEFLQDPRDDQYKLIEINARTWLWVGLAKACGVDYAKISYEFANNLPSHYPETYQLNKKWVNLLTDIPYSIIAIIKRKLSFADYIGSFRGSYILAVFHKRDLLPSLLLPFLLLVRIKNKLNKK
jgi:D-aspartate ligase